MSYIDLATTISGDLYFEPATQNNELRIAFDLSFNDNESLIISFKHNKHSIPDINNNSLKISFDNNYNNDRYKACCVFDREALKKRIEYAIRTTLTDLKENSDFGSDLELYMHQNIRDNTVISNLESAISKALVGFVDSMTVKVSPKISYTQSGYFQGVTIDIYSYGEIITSYTV